MILNEVSKTLKFIESESGMRLPGAGGREKLGGTNQSAEFPTPRMNKLLRAAVPPCA